MAELLVETPICSIVFLRSLCRSPHDSRAGLQTLRSGEHDVIPLISLGYCLQALAAVSPRRQMFLRADGTLESREAEMVKMQCRRRKRNDPYRLLSGPFESVAENQTVYTEDKLLNDQAKNVRGAKNLKNS